MNKIVDLWKRLWKGLWERCEVEVEKVRIWCIKNEGWLIVCGKDGIMHRVLCSFTQSFTWLFFIKKQRGGWSYTHFPHSL